MRSMFTLAALVAVVGFTGCCGTGDGSKIGNVFGAGKGIFKSNDEAAVSTESCDSCSGGDLGCSACGSDTVVSVSAPYACDGGCGESVPADIPASCGCSSCDAGNIMQYEAPVDQTPVQSGGCDSCSSASNSKKLFGMFAVGPQKDGLASNKGMGLLLKGKGKVCQEARTLAPTSEVQYETDMGVVSGESCGCSESCSECVGQTVAEMPRGVLFAGTTGERRISTGVISDIRGARSQKKHDHANVAQEVAGSCEARGCSKGKHCGKIGGLSQKIGLGHPYGGAKPHTNPAVAQQRQSGIAPQYAYPYYTTRGPRDFLRDNPSSIGY